MRHVKASAVLAKVRMGLRPQGAEAVADDLKSVIRVRGTESQIEEMRMIVALFEVASRVIDHTFRISSPVDKLQNQGTIQLQNCMEFTFRDSTSGLIATIGSRINDDDTMTTFVTFDIDGALFRTSKRQRGGVQFVAKAVEAEPLNEKAKRRLEYKSTVSWPELVVTARINRSDERRKRSGS